MGSCSTTTLFPSLQRNIERGTLFGSEFLLSLCVLHKNHLGSTSRLSGLPREVDPKRRNLKIGKEGWGESVQGRVGDPTPRNRTSSDGGR